MKNFLKAVLFVCAFVTATPAFAAADSPVITVNPTGVSGCYTQKEAEAEQAIRIHSELMVIGLNCQHMTPPGQKNLYQSYREFTAAHSGLFAGYETTLMGYFSRIGTGSPEAALNTMRTEFANKISLDSARMRPDLFCNHYMPRIQKVSTMDRAAIQKWAATFFPGHPTTRPVCK